MSERRMGEDGAEEDLVGVLVESTIFEGSKSERVSPVLVLEDGSFVHVFVMGESAFESSTLKDHVGQRVELKGTWRRGTFRVAADAFHAVEP